jgi:hypothetical protein
VQAVVAAGSTALGSTGTLTVHGWTWQPNGDPEQQIEDLRKRTDDLEIRTRKVADDLGQRISHLRGDGFGAVSEHHGQFQQLRQVQEARIVRR